MKATLRLGGGHRSVERVEDTSEILEAERADARTDRVDEPHYKTARLADDWESVPNSFDAVEFAYISDLLTDEDYAAIVEAAPAAESSAND